MADATFTLDKETIQTLINQSIQDKVLSAVEELSQDPNWLARVERMINQAVVQETISRIGSIDINTIIKERVDDNLNAFRKSLIGINDQSSATQLTIMDDTTVVENMLTTRELTVVDSATINNLAVRGSINTDNHAWDTLADNITEKTLEKLTTDWRDKMVADVAADIQTKGINIDNVLINGSPLINDTQLSKTITSSNLQSVGILSSLQVSGNTLLSDTLSVGLGRVGINTESPEMAMSIWDEEVAINVGKHKSGTGYIGTSRPQGLVIGINRQPQIEIDPDGLTTIKKLRIGIHQLSYSNDVPGWSGTRGDIVFNSDPKSDLVFAWVCLGGFKWQTLKSA